MTSMIICYIVGTLLGLWMGYSSGIKQGAQTTIDALIATNFLRYRKRPNGEIEILQVEEKIPDNS